MRTLPLAVAVSCFGLTLAGCGDDTTRTGRVLDATVAQDTGTTPTPDTGSVVDMDASTSDVETPEIGIGDAGSPADAAPGDAVAVDTGADAGSADTGQIVDSGPADTGSVDGGLPPGDAGTGGADGGTTATCNPNFGQAPPTCGGNPAGSWTIREACGDSPLLQQLATQCPGATVANVVRTATGNLDVQGTTYTLRVMDNATADLNLPAFCAIAVGGCGAVPGVIANIGGTATCMANAAGDCACSVTVTTMRNEAGPFMQMGATLIAGSNTYDHCVNGPAMEIHERMSGSVYVLGR